ncbi:MAG: F0F1 ATP synthase subunit B' [Beijerinckiaceae bacterium]
MMFSLIGTAHAADAVKAKGGSAFPPFDATTFPAQIFWFVLIFGALYWLMSKVALPRVEGILESRAAKIDGDLQAAALMQEKAKVAGEAYEKLLSDAKSNAQGIGQKAKDEAISAADKQRKVVEEENNRKVAESEASISKARDVAMGNVTSIAADAASEIIKRISGVAPKADDVKRAVASVQS